MSQRDEDDLKVQLQKTEAAREKAAREWQRLDATLYNPDLAPTEKLGVISHIRTANSETGQQWASAAHHAVAMGVTTVRAERIMRKLRNDGVFELVSSKEGKTNTVKLSQPWMAKVEQVYLEWKAKRPRAQAAGVSEATTPGTEVRQPRAQKCGDPGHRSPTILSIYPATDAVDENAKTQPTVAHSIQPQVDQADTSKLEPQPAAGLQEQPKTSVRPRTDKNDKGEIPGFNGDTWPLVDRLAKLDAVKGFERYRVRARIQDVSLTTSPEAVRLAIADLERAAAEGQLGCSAVRALLGFARKASQQPQKPQGAPWMTFKGGAFQP